LSFGNEEEHRRTNRRPRAEGGCVEQHHEQPADSTAGRPVKERNVRVQASVVVLGLAIAVPAVAQVRDPNQQVADQQQATQKNQMRTYELILRQAVEHGGQEFAVWTDQVAPGLLLASVSPPIISSIPVPGRGIVFDIQIPEIIPMQNKFLTEMIRRQPQ